MTSCNPTRGQRRNGRCHTPPEDLSTLEAVVEDYIRAVRPGACDYLGYHADQPSLEEAVRAVASWEDPSGGVYSHQHRPPREAKSEAGRRLRAGDYAGIQTFEELHDRIEGWFLPIDGAGELMVYDAALRIGAFLGLEPAYVYLHRGAAKGAAALGIWSDWPVSPTKFPDAFRALEPWEIEDCLCRYKRELWRIASTRPAA